MNINTQSADFGKVVPWDSLTDEQKNSGDWILLPDVSNEPRRARKNEDAMIREERDRQTRVFDAFLAASRPSSASGSFDAAGKVR